MDNSHRFGASIAKVQLKDLPSGKTLQISAKISPSSATHIIAVSHGATKSTTSEDQGSLVELPIG